MKILLASNSHRTAGAENYLYILAKGLASRGEDVYLICPNRKEWDELAERFSAERIKVKRMLLRSRHDYGRFFFLAFLNVIQIFRLVKMFKCYGPDILHINAAGVEDSHTLIIAGKIAGVRKIVVTFHIGNFLPYKVKSLHVGLIDLFRKFIVRRVVSLSNETVAISETTKNEILQRYNLPQAKINVIHNGIDLDGFELHKNIKISGEPFRRENETLLIAVCNLFPQKGTKYLLEALVNVDRVRCLIVGDGDLRKRLIEQAYTLEIQDKVIFLGKRDDVPALLNSADIFVLPSIDEGFPFVVLEAMATGLPVIATIVGGVPEMIQDGEEGILVESRNPEALAEAITKLSKSKDLRMVMGKKARKKIEENFSAIKMTDHTLEVYKRCVGE